MINNKTAAYASFMICIGVALGAVGSHLLKDLISEHYARTFETGVRYQVYSGLGMLLLSFAGDSQKWSTRLILIGSLIFCCSLYLLSLNEILGEKLKMMGAIAPLGGLSMITGWGIACWNFLKKSRT